MNNHAFPWVRCFYFVLSVQIRHQNYHHSCNSFHKTYLTNTHRYAVEQVEAVSYTFRRHEANTEQNHILQICDYQRQKKFCFVKSENTNLFQAILSSNKLCTQFFAVVVTAAVLYKNHVFKCCSVPTHTGT